MPETSGFILYEGPSNITGQPIIVVVTTTSANIKTGDMLQCWILDASEHPIDAIRSGADKNVCGDCPLRSSVCYVELGKAPAGVFRKYKRGGYPSLTAAQIRRRCAGRSARFGAYGDPAAAPLSIWMPIVHACGGRWTAYTHQWRRAPEFKSICMASVDNLEELEAAQRLGWRTFRVRAEDEAPHESECQCPAAAESGHVDDVQCIDCLLCDGTNLGQHSHAVRSVSLTVHGRGSKAFRNMQAEGSPAIL